MTRRDAEGAEKGCPTMAAYPANDPESFNIACGRQNGMFWKIPCNIFGGVSQETRSTYEFLIALPLSGLPDDPS